MTSLFALLNRSLCWLAAFPYDRFVTLHTPWLRIQVMARGLALAISSVALTAGLMWNGTKIVGQSPYLYLLPVCVALVDWIMIARSYGDSPRSWSLVLMRVVILSMTLFVATYCAILGEQDELIKSLHQAQDEATMNGDVARELAARDAAIVEQIAQVERRLNDRALIKAEILESRRLEALECGGAAGIDPRTGVQVVGGKCGTRAATHRINAESAEARLAQLTDLDEIMTSLGADRESIRLSQRENLAANRSSIDSKGALLAALAHANGGVFSTVFSVAIVLLIVEALALILASLPVPATLREAVRYSIVEDELRLEAIHAAALAKIAMERDVLRREAAERQTPLQVTITPLPFAKTRPASEPVEGVQKPTTVTSLRDAA
jgi:hypothetical protein